MKDQDLDEAQNLIFATRAEISQGINPSPKIHDTSSKFSHSKWKLPTSKEIARRRISCKARASENKADEARHFLPKPAIHEPQVF